MSAGASRGGGVLSVAPPASAAPVIAELIRARAGYGSRG